MMKPKIVGKTVEYSFDDDEKDINEADKQSQHMDIEKFVGNLVNMSNTIE